MFVDNLIHYFRLTDSFNVKILACFIIIKHKLIGNGCDYIVSVTFVNGYFATKKPPLLQGGVKGLNSMT